MPWEGGYVFETFEQYELPDRFRVDVQERENRIEVALKIVTHAGTSLAARVSPQAGRIRHHHYRQGSGHSAKASAA
jgi:predicted component of type VI protein secretion system